MVAQDEDATVELDCQAMFVVVYDVEAPVDVTSVADVPVV